MTLIKPTSIFHGGPLAPTEHQAAVDVINAFSRWINGANMTSLEERQSDWAEEGFNPQLDTWLVRTQDGRIVGYADQWDITSQHVRLFSFIAVDPDYLNQGIEDELAEWMIKRGLQRVNHAPDGTRVVVQISANIENQLMAELFARHGYQRVRRSYRMRIDLATPPPAPVIPAGFEIRAIQPGEEKMAIYAAFDSFRDHWGFVEEPFENYYRRWKHDIENYSAYDPSLYFAAMAGDEVAGVSLCYPTTEEDPGMAWVGTLGVRRPYRRHGLGLALLQHSFGEFYRRGIRRAGLGVDAENLTGALRLYEKVGMRVWRGQGTYEYELRAGKDLMRQNLDGQAH